MTAAGSLGDDASILVIGTGLLKAGGCGLECTSRRTNTVEAAGRLGPLEITEVRPALA